MCFAGNLYAEWTELNPGVTHNLYDCYFLTPQLGFFTGFENDADPIIIGTSTGGYFWTQNVPYPNIALYSIFFVDSDTGFVVGHDDTNGFGVIIKTSDSGTQWNNFIWEMGCTTIYDIDFPSYDIGYVSADNGYVFKTPNTGTTWQPKSLDGYPQVKFIDFVNENSGFVIAESESKVYKTNDAGDSWNPICTYEDLKVGGIHFFDENNGIFVGRTLNNYSEVIYRTTNGCSTFNQVFTGIDNSSLNDVHFCGSRGWAVGDNGRILRTNNSGATWFLDDTLDPPVNLHCVFDTGESIYVGGEQGKVFKKDEYYPAESEPEVPGQYFTSYPNPFSTSTFIKFSNTTEITEDAEITIYNIKGQLIKTLSSFPNPSLGMREAMWDGRDENGKEVGTGVYSYKINNDDEHIGKVVKLK
jgi:photosystem II stability/assembly factor-like uncharacterized protein